MMILYSTNCPRCNVLKNRMENKKIDYQLITDEKEMIDKGFQTSPILEIDGTYYQFSEAMNIIKEMDNNG